MTISPLPHWLVIAYLAAHSIYILTGRYRPPRPFRILLTNVFLAVLFLVQILLLDSSPPLADSFFTTIALWSPIVFFWWAYLWAGHTLCVCYPPGFSFDAALVKAEGRFFGQLSLRLAAADSPWLNDLFHVLYNTYYFYTLLLGVFLHAAGRIAEFQAVMLAVILGYATAYAFFPLIPVWGPRWGLVSAGLLPETRQRLSGSWLTRATNRLMWEGLAHRGCAFPSAHVSTGVIFVVWSWRIWGVEGVIIASLIVFGMALGAVYARYHYVLDVIAGALLGVACLLVADGVI